MMPVDILMRGICWVDVLMMLKELGHHIEKWFPLQGEQAHSLKLFCMYDKRFEISKTK